MTPNRVLNAWVRALTALARVTRRVRITSTSPDLAFGVCGGRLAQDGSGDLLGVEPVGLAVHVPGQPVGPVDLDDRARRRRSGTGSGSPRTSRCSRHRSHSTSPCARIQASSVA